MKKLGVSEFIPSRPMPVCFDTRKYPHYTLSEEKIIGVNRGEDPQSITPSFIENYYAHLNHRYQHLPGGQFDLYFKGNADLRGSYYFDRHADEEHPYATDVVLNRGQKLLTDFLTVAARVSVADRGSANAIYQRFCADVVSLCDKYGLVATQEHSDVLRSMRVPFPLSFAIHNCAHYGFDTQTMLSAFGSLYGLYLSWKMLTWGISEDELALLRWEYEKHMLFPLPSGENGVHSIRHQIKLMSMHVTTTNIVDFCESGEVFTYSRYSCPIDAAFGLVLKLISMGNEALENKCLSYCKRCGNEYIKRHGNSTLCDVCKAPAMKTRASRAKRAKEAQLEKKSQQ